MTCLGRGRLFGGRGPRERRFEQPRRREYVTRTGRSRNRGKDHILRRRARKKRKGPYDGSKKKNEPQANTEDQKRNTGERGGLQKKGPPAIFTKLYCLGRLITAQLCTKNALLVEWAQKKDDGIESHHHRGNSSKEPIRLNCFDLMSAESWRKGPKEPNEYTRNAEA